jgi:thioredoxin reductase
MNVSPLGMQSLSSPPLDGEQVVTGREMVERYYEPLARCKLLASVIAEGTRVIAVGRRGFLKGEALGSDERARAPFVLRLQRSTGEAELAEADVVIDATGTYGNPNWVGDGGIPALGELVVREQIEYGVPDVLGREREKYAGKETLVIGAGYSAATTMVALSALAREVPQTRVTWITRASGSPDCSSPIRRVENDRLPLRAKLASSANTLAARSTGPVIHYPGKIVSTIREYDEMFWVDFSTHEGQTFDRIIANVGYHPDRSIYEELHVHECYATGGPMRLAETLVGDPSADCLDQKPACAESLITTEPNFFILGSKSYGRLSRLFLLANGLEQVRQLFDWFDRGAT